MIGIDRTDEEREELVKKWIRSHWLHVIMAVAVAIAGVYGFNMYKDREAQNLSNAAAQMENALELLAKDDTQAAQKIISSLQTEQEYSSFANLSTLTLAKQYFDSKQYDKAEEQYDWIISNSQDPSTRDLARLRMARAQANDKDYVNAINSLLSLETNTFQLEASLLKGDVYTAAGNFADARKTYEDAKKGGAANEQLIQQRLDLLTIKEQKARS